MKLKRTYLLKDKFDKYIYIYNNCKDYPHLNCFSALSVNDSVNDFIVF